ncbi:MAG: carboxypeptidase-like regulatory domain-containing protein [Bryobacteraceae bacterium]
MKSSNPSHVLENLRVETPCQADWNEMTGDRRARFCDHCQKSVHDVSAMTREDAAALLASGEKVCVRFSRDAAGAMMTADSGSYVLLQRRTFAAILAAGMASALLPIFGQQSQPPAMLIGEVVTAKGAPVGHATVRLNRGTKTLLEVETDARGRFRISKSQPGVYSLAVEAPGFQPAEQRAALEQGASLRAKVVMMPQIQMVTMGVPMPPPKH